MKLTRAISKNNKNNSKLLFLPLLSFLTGARSQGLCNDTVQPTASNMVITERKFVMLKRVIDTSHRRKSNFFPYIDKYAV